MLVFRSSRASSASFGGGNRAANLPSTNLPIRRLGPQGKRCLGCTDQLRDASERRGFLRDCVFSDGAAWKVLGVPGAAQTRNGFATRVSWDYSLARLCKQA